MDGGGGAGKSTLAREVAAIVDRSTIVEGDDFYRVMDEDERAALRPDTGYDRYFDSERLRDEVLVPLRARDPARYRRFDWDAAKRHGLTTTVVEVKPHGVVIVEGVYCNRPELSELRPFCVR
jgi:uridine kinase